MSVYLWAEKYRPARLADYVWRDPDMKAKFKEWITEGALPNLLLSGKSGLGKTSLLKMCLNELGVPSGDVLEINASRERKVDDIQDRILSFAATYPMIDNPHGLKYVLLDEADSMSPLAQKFLRAEIDNYHKTTRFLFTCNYPSKIIPALIGRCQQFHFEALDQSEFVVRLGAILEAEKIEYQIDTLLPFIEETYPDLRKCINLVQQSAVGRELRPLQKNDGKADDYILTAIEHFKAKRFNEGRKLIVSQASVEEYPDVYRFLYQNLDLWGDQSAQDAALLIIRDGLYKHTLICDPEINLSAVILELCNIGQK